MPPMSLRHGCVQGIKRATNLACCHGNCLMVAMAVKCVCSPELSVEALVSEYEAGVGECDSDRLEGREMKITGLLSVCVFWIIQKL